MKRLLERTPERSDAASARDWPDVPARKPRPRKIDYRPYGCAAMAAIVGLLLLTPAGYVAYAWYDLSQPPGVVPYSEWPPGLKAKCEEWNDADVYIDGMEVYDASTFIDTEAYCRVRYTPETWAYLKERYGRPGDTASARLMWEGVRAELPDWAPNLVRADVELLPIEPYGDGEHVRLAYDPSRQMIYISYLTIF